VLKGLAGAWNAGDALAFAGYFEEDAHMVNIHGMHLRSRQAIAWIYQMLLRSVFAASSANYTISSVRMLRKNVALVHAKVAMKIPAGPMAGGNSALTSIVMICDSGEWTVTSLHTTLVTAAGA
jgi:uncharacterized protein (TIGR02246 family)